MYVVLSGVTDWIVIVVYPLPHHRPESLLEKSSLGFFYGQVLSLAGEKQYTPPLGFRECLRLTLMIPKCPADSSEPTPLGKTNMTMGNHDVQ